MERKFILCECGWAEHQLLFFYDPDEDDSRFYSLYVEVHLSTWKGFFRRLWAAIRYVFGYRSRYGHWDSIMIDVKQAKELLDFITKFLNPCC